MKKITFMLFAFLSMITIGFAQTETLAEWTPVTVTAADSFGQSPFAASTTADNLVVGGLTRGSGIGTTAGTPAANAWGGNDFTATSAVESIDENEFVTFAITADAGYTFSIESIEPYNIRRSNAGPNTGQWQYQLDGGTFVNIGSEITWGGTTTNAGNNQPAIDLSGIADLQNIDAGTAVTFRILLWGATGTGGTWYLNGHNNATNPTLTILGTVEEESSSVPIIYCEINSDYYDVEEITSVVFGDDTTITNTNDTDILVDFTSTIADVEQGETYTITVKGYTGGDYDNEYVAFIDWNQNGILDDAGEVYYIGLIYDSTGYDGQSASTTISVPTTALTGETRIRITKTYTDEFYEVSLNIDPCYISTYEVGWGLDGSYGQALDFTINVLANDPCVGAPAPTFSQIDPICEGDTLAPLPTTSTNGINGTWSPALDNTQTTTYTFTPNEGECGGPVEMTIVVTPFVVPVFTGLYPDIICSGETFSLPTTSADGINGTWFPAFDNTQTTTYEFTPDSGQCAESVSITIIVNETPAVPTADSPQTLTDGQTVADIVVTDVTGTLTWYDNDENVIDASMVLTEGTYTFWVTQTIGDCTSDALDITVTVIDDVDPCADLEAPTAESPQTITVEQTFADIIVDGENLTWYSDSDLTEIVEDFVFEEGTYTFWVTQTVGDCISEATEIQVEVTLSTDTFDNTSFRTYPNPVRDFFNISYSNDITNVAVINMLGQTIIVKTVNATDTQIDMSGLPTGTYFVKVNIDGLIKTIKVAKQ